MPFIDHPQHNIVYIKPKEWPEDRPCQDLKCHKGVDENNETFIEVAYMPSPEVLADIAAGRPLRIRLIARGICPLSIYTEDGKGGFNE